MNAAGKALAGAMTHTLLERLQTIEHAVGHTPLVPIDHPTVNLFAKLECCNPVGSIKDRPALWILKTAIQRGQIGPSTTIVESSSGNLAVALACFCRLAGLRFVPVIDPNITPCYASMLRASCDEVVVVEARDDTGGFLKSRLAKVREICRQPDTFWTNQYGNPVAAEAHYQTTGREICEAVGRLDFLFIGVSSAGTITGVSRRVKEVSPDTRIIAVDAEGSVAFGAPSKKRFIPGIGASIVPPLLKEARIDEVVWVPEADAIAACHHLARRHGLLVGGSSGSAYAAVQRYFGDRGGARRPNVLFLCADRGTAYFDTVYNPDWVRAIGGSPCTLRFQ